MTELDLPACMPATASPEPGAWIQYNLPPHGMSPAALLALAEQALADGTATDFFFMHKPPGLRLRFHAPDPAALRFDLERHLSGAWRPAVYEPEQRLFGGATSMRSVHRVFTADSLAWLAFQSARGDGAYTTWAFSLLTIRALLAALEIVGWEDLDVWDRLSRDGGRELAATAVADERVERIVAVLRSGWADPERLRKALPGNLHPVVDRYRAAVEVEAPRWIADYFTAPGAEVGPRQVAALLVIFHWNRGRLPVHHQALITHALGCRQVIA